MLDSNDPSFRSSYLSILETKRVNEKLTQDVSLESNHSRIQGMRDSKDPFLSHLLGKNINELRKRKRNSMLIECFIALVKMDCEMV